MIRNGASVGFVIKLPHIFGIDTSQYCGSLLPCWRRFRRESFKYFAWWLSSVWENLRNVLVDTLRVSLGQKRKCVISGKGVGQECNDSLPTFWLQVCLCATERRYLRYSAWFHPARTKEIFRWVCYLALRRAQNRSSTLVVGWPLLGDRFRWPVLLLEPKGAITMNLILNAHRAWPSLAVERPLHSIGVINAGTPCLPDLRVLGASIAIKMKWSVIAEPGIYRKCGSDAASSKTSRRNSWAFCSMSLWLTVKKPSFTKFHGMGQYFVQAACDIQTDQGASISRCEIE